MLHKSSTDHLVTNRTRHSCRRISINAEFAQFTAFFFSNFRQLRQTISAQALSLGIAHIVVLDFSVIWVMKYSTVFWIKKSAFKAPSENNVVWSASRTFFLHQVRHDICQKHQQIFQNSQIYPNKAGNA